nr:MATH domain and coiled-coil domain-containing protein At3g58400 [Ipomoea batatas]
MAIVREDGVSLSTVDAAPSHFMLKIQSVSLLTQYKIEKYTSTPFEAGGYKWKLIFYPNGNRVKDHISMHLAVADTGGFQPGWEVHAVFRLFLLDQNNDTYFVVQDAEAGKGRRFRGTMREWGFERFISLTTFKDQSYGYVVDDVCVIGAEVYVHKEFKSPKGETRFPRGECLSMFKDPDPAKHYWKIYSFFALQRHYHESPTFQQWRMRVYPKGMDGKGTHLSLFLHMDLGNEAKEQAPSRIYAEFTLRLIDERRNQKNFTKKETRWLSPSTRCEWLQFIPMETFKASFWSSSKDKCVIDVEVRVHGETIPLHYS